MPDVSALIAHFPYFGLFVLLVLGGIGLPFPEDTTLILTGFLISHRVIRVFPAIIVVYIGALIADVLIFAVGRKYGRRIVDHPRFQRLLTRERLFSLEERFKKQGVILILAGRHLIGLRAQIFLAAGVMKMPVAKFILADACSLTLTIALMVGVGILGGNSLQIIEKDVRHIEHVAIFLAFLVFVAYLVRRYFSSWRGRKPAK